MAESKHKVGDKVLIKNVDWYKRNTIIDTEGFFRTSVRMLCPVMFKYLDTIDNMFKSDLLEVRVRLTNNILLAICIFLDEPLNSPVLFSVHHDDELVMSDNMELDKLVEEVLNALKRINNTENITKGE